MLYSAPRRYFVVFVELLSLTTFAFAQSVYQAIAGNPEFIVLNRITHADLLLVVAVFNLAPAVVLFVAWWLLERWRPAAADSLLSACFLLLLTPFLLELHKTYLSPVLRFSHNTVLVALPLCLAGWVVFAYRAEFQRVLLVLSPLILVFPAWFLLRAWRQVSPPAGESGTAFSVARVTHDRQLPRPPVCLLILDEFTRPALLDDSGAIDAARFPNFADFARHSTWFTNATANAEYTTRSIPVIVTGSFPRGNDPSDRAYPNNLFRLLAPDYDITVREVVTRFCVPGEYHCPDAERVARQGHLLWAVGELYLWRVAPKSVVLGIQGRDLRQEQGRFGGFLAGIRPGAGAKPMLQFMHLELPHAPYLLRPDGSLHMVEPNSFEGRFAGDTVLLERLRGDYVAQIQYVDREFGEFLRKLKESGLYDQSLIIVTSDHGVSWKANAPGRVLSEANADMIFPVPLFIKQPGQTEGRTSTEDAQLIDVLPTIAAAVAIDPPWPVAGRNLFGADSPPRQKIMIDASGRRFAYPQNFAASPPAHN